MKIAIIGAGAAGIFAAIRCASQNANAHVTLFEKSSHVLSKVKVSGGGRCNVTHACYDAKQLSTFYPRGNKELKSCFSQFNVLHTVEWFASKGVALKTEEDGRMFPVTDNSQTIINCLMREAENAEVELKTESGITSVKIVDDKFILTINNSKEKKFDKILVTSGGGATLKSYDWLRLTGHSIVLPVPSLFTFNIPNSKLKGLEGIAMGATIKVCNTSLEETGPVLITHWGISGPAVLRCSAWGARLLNEMNYTFDATINWISINDDAVVKNILNNERKHSSAKRIFNKALFEIPNRLWIRICELSGISEKENFSDLSKAKLNALIENLIRFKLHAKGKTTFKEEFVTCGGIPLTQVNLKTMESKLVKNLFFAGEVLDIDGVTGGFNFQNAWTTGWIAGTNIGTANSE